MDIDALIEFSAPGIAELLNAITLFGKGSHGLRHHRAVIRIGAGQRVAQDIADAGSCSRKAHLVFIGIAHNLARQTVHALEAVIKALQLGR